jgi:hypothetical protein
MKYMFQHFLLILKAFYSNLQVRYEHIIINCYKLVLFIVIKNKDYISRTV